MKGAVVNVSTGDHYCKGQQRLKVAVGNQAEFIAWTNVLPAGSPSHYDVPYAFKAYALEDCAARGHSLLLWADASILPVAPLGPLFERIERDGYWISNNGYMNSQWTADSAYPDLGVTREENATIKHVVATSFGISTAHPVGRAILHEYGRLARTNAFKGPWTNHRHDQTSLSVIAWRLGLELTDPPEIFSYPGGQRKGTVLLADGAY